MILALDSSTSWLSIALGSAEEVFFHLTHYTQKDHSRWLIKHLSLLQKEFNWEKDLEIVLVGLGPGSFTGVKIANIVAKGIAYSLGKPLGGFSTLEVIAHQVPERIAQDYEILLPVIKHKRKEVFWMELSPQFQECCSFPEIQAGPKEEVATKYEGRNVLVITPWVDIAEFLESKGFSFFAPRESLPEARGLIELYRRRENEAMVNRENIFTLVPFYGSKVWG
ncbi:MAG: tRNA (adenosine(37)-N6)-threonylcarbamoyltransferase complex dimerization subunit type 1 TsaB [Atribacterales bacterium]|jgi:tRNA threonylcarbamoyl adenosine modification protein YeaZ|nr:tRNA (adenosine(37)-N6)-threonylcarbamoyltransferase complex dimerization subunit type 1 TsaB [Atribacterota bacterium]